MLWRRLVVTTLPCVAAVLVTACGPTEQAAERSDSERAAPADAGADRAAVEAAVAAHWEAVNSGDSLAVMSQHTPDITLFVADAEPRFALASPEAAPLVERFRGARPDWTVEELEIQLMEGVAVATFYLSGSVRWADGTVDDRRRRVTEVWTKQPDGSWKEAHHHDSVMALP